MLFMYCKLFPRNESCLWIVKYDSITFDLVIIIIIIVIIIIIIIISSSSTKIIIILMIIIINLIKPVMTIDNIKN